MKRLLSLALSLAMVCALGVGETWAAGSPSTECKCSLCGSSFLYGRAIESPFEDVNARKTYQEYYNVGQIVGLSTDMDRLYCTGAATGTAIELCLTLYNGSEICQSCLETKIEEYKAANAVPAGMQKVDSSTGAADLPVVVTREAAVFSATVPTSLPISLAADGSVSTSDNAMIINNSALPVCVSAVKVTAASDWSLNTFDKAAMLKEAPGSKQLGLSISLGSNTSSTTKTGSEETIASYSHSDVTIGAGSSLTVGYDAALPGQPDGLSGVQAASVIFTLDWAS